MYSIRDPAGVKNPEFIALGAPSNGKVTEKVTAELVQPWMQGGKFRQSWNG